MGEILLSGTASGGSSVSAGHVYELDDVATGASQFSGAMVLVKAAFGYAAGRSSLGVWAPEKLEGFGRLMGTLQVVRLPRPLVQDSPKCFRWGYQFGPGDLEFLVTGHAGTPLGASCVGFTIYQIQRGCFPRQIGPKDRKPGVRSLGVYYAIGTAGECGQPGLWMIRWCYRKGFGEAPLYGDCYFWVLDTVLCPVAGDTLPRVLKWGWG